MHKILKLQNVPKFTKDEKQTLNLSTQLTDFETKSTFSKL